MGNIKGNSGDSIEWHQKKTREYFADCFKVYDHFLKMSDELIFALLKYVNDGTHTGPEADASKAFINEKQIPLIENSIYCIQKLQSMMTGKGFESNVPLLEDFIADMSENEEAVIKLDHVGKVITDFAGYNTTFKAVHPKVTDIHDEVEKLVKDCDEIKRKSFTNPNPGATNTALDAFVNTDKSAGFVPGFKNKFTNFHNEHSNDIEGSAFKELLDVIVANMKTILEGLQKGTFDITKYVGRGDSLKWIDPTKLNSDQLDEYLKYLQSYRLYLQGYIDRCQVYKYDPVNLSSGNYINDRVDIEIGGLDFRRFYNAKSEFRGFLGRGWSCKADVRLREENGDIKITYPDGKEGLYKKIEQTENSYYEIHGEIGILKKENSYYRIEKDYGEYEEYDAEGYLVAEGDHTGEKTHITYDNSYPVKIEESNGSYLILSYNENGLIIGVTDSEGRKVTFGYETREGNGRKDYFLTDVTYPNGSIRRYIYDEAGLIQNVISPDGIVALKNEYDEYGRVIHQAFPDGGEMSYSYDDEKRITIATEQNGLKVEYLSDELGRHIGTRYLGLNDNFTKQSDFDKKDFIEEKYTYNERSQKTSFTDKNGHTTRYSYDKKGHLTKIVGPEGLNESYTYDAQGRLLSKKDSEGNKYKYTYDFDGNLYSITDPLGNRTKYDYKGGKVVRIKDAESNEISITYDENGNISSLTDKNGVKTLYLCDKQGRVNKTIDAEGNETGYCFDENGNITEVIDPIGNRTSYKYTKSDLLTEVINPDGTSKVWGYNEIGKVAFFKDEEDRITEFSYNNMWNKEKMILPNGGEVLYSYDLLGNLIKTTDPEGRKTVYSYDNEGNILSLGIESGEKKILTKTIYTYDKRGRVISEVDAEGNKTLYSYDKNGNLICKTDALGGKTSYEYDSLQRVVKQTDAIGRTTLYTYNKNGKEDTVTDPAGVVTRNYYSKDRLIKVTQKESAEHAKELTVKTYEYDSCGRIKKEKLADGFTASYEYDKAGRISVITGSNGRVMKHYYDSMGRIIEQDDCGTKTFYTYTGTGKLKSITDALGNEIRYSYNELDLLCKIERTGKDSESLEGRVTTFEHDLAGNLTGETDALSQKTLYSYDDMGELCTKTDRDGNETIYTRDGNGNITGIRYMDGSEVIYKYDALNTLMEVKEKIGLTKIDSDVLGRTVKVTNPRGEVVEYEYGVRDEKTAIVYPDGKRVDYLYDAFGNLTELKEKSKDGKEQSIKYKYDEIGNLRQKLFPNNTSTEYEYYQGGFIKSLVSNDRDGVLDKYEYIYNEKGNATQVKRDRRGLAGVSGIFSYSYDELGRLTESKKDGVLVDSYSYDAYGNRVEQNSSGIKTTYSYDILDRLVNKVEYSRDAKTNTTRYSYDKRGNLIEEYENEILSKTYDFNMQGFIEHAVIDPESELSRKINYEYNYAGMRVSKESDREKVRYVTDVTMDHNNLIMEIRDGEVITYTYDEDVVSIENGKNRSFYQTDELGSTMYLTGTDGAAYCSYAYDVFGNRLDPQTGKRYRNNPDGHKYIKHGNIIQPFAFTGYREEEDGKYYAQARDYDPTSGRFTGEDRVRGIMTIPDSVNHYLYCINDPITYVDNNGLLFGWLKKAAKSVVSAVKTAGNAVVNTVKTVGTAAVNTVKKVGKAIAEDPCKFLAEVGTGIVVGLATTAAAVAVVATLPVSGPALVAAGAVAMGAAGAATGTVANIAGQLASKEFEKTGKINWKEVGSSAIGGAIGGAVFGGAAGAAGSAMGSRAMQLTVAGLSGEAGGMAAEGTRQAMNGEKFNLGKFIESGLMGGLTGMACAAIPVGGGSKSSPSRPNSSCTAENATLTRPEIPANESVGNARPEIPANEPVGNVRPANSNRVLSDEISESPRLSEEVTPNKTTIEEGSVQVETPESNVPKYNDIHSTEGLPVLGEENDVVIPQSRPEVQSEASSGDTSDYISDFELPGAQEVEPVAYYKGRVATPKQIADNVELINNLWEQGYNAEPNKTQSDISMNDGLGEGPDPNTYHEIIREANRQPAFGDNRYRFIDTESKVGENVPVNTEFWDEGYNAKPNSTPSDISNDLIDENIHGLGVEGDNGNNAIPRFEDYNPPREYDDIHGMQNLPAYGEGNNDLIPQNRPQVVSQQEVNGSIHENATSNQEPFNNTKLSNNDPIREGGIDVYDNQGSDKYFDENNYDIQSEASTSNYSDITYDNSQSVSSNNAKFVEDEAQNLSDSWVVDDDQQVINLDSDEMWQDHNLGQKSQDAINVISEESSYEFPEGDISKVNEPVTSLDNVSENHQAAVRSYTGGRDQKYNGYKRGKVKESDLSDYEKKVIKYLDDTLDNAYLKINDPQKNSMELYRGSHLDELGELIPYDPLKKQYTLENFDVQQLVGKTYKQEGYTSTSTSKEGALDGDLFITIEAPEGSKALNISSKSKLGGESEVLFHAGQDYEIISANVENGILHIKVKPVESPGAQSGPQVVSQQEVNGSIHENASVNHESSNNGAPSNREVIRDEVIQVNYFKTRFIFNPFKSRPGGNNAVPAQAPEPVQAPVHNDAPIEQGVINHFVEGHGYRHTRREFEHESFISDDAASDYSDPSFLENSQNGMDGDTNPLVPPQESNMIEDVNAIIDEASDDFSYSSSDSLSDISAPSLSENSQNGMDADILDEVSDAGVSIHMHETVEEYEFGEVQEYHAMYDDGSYAAREHSLIPSIIDDTSELSYLPPREDEPATVARRNAIRIPNTNENAAQNNNNRILPDDILDGLSFSSDSE